MRKKSLLKYEVISSIIVMILGTLLHFTYEWLGKNPFIGIFSAVNESTWEHLKLVFYPLLLATIIGTIIFKDTHPSYLWNKTKSILFSMFFVVAFFYISSGIIGKSFPFLNISSYYLAIILGEIYFYKRVINVSENYQLLSYIILILFTISFTIFTFYPPHIGIFKDPISSTYGI